MKASTATLILTALAMAMAAPDGAEVEKRELDLQASAKFRREAIRKLDENAHYLNLDRRKLT